MRTASSSWITAASSKRAPHDQLMAQGGHYAELYNTYVRHQSLEYIESFVG
jgi:hypothetical protein